MLPSRNHSGWWPTFGWWAAGWTTAVVAALVVPRWARAQDTASPPKGAPIPERPAFDLTYVPPEATGVVAVRPSVIFGDPAMRPLAGRLNEALTQLLHVFQLPTEPQLPIEDIEQVVGFISIRPNTTPLLLRGRHTLTATLALIRTTHDFDWLKVFQQLDPDLEKIYCGGRVYYRSHPKFLKILSPDVSFCFFMPDKRTLALPQEKELRAMLTGKAGVRPPFSWEKDWKHVEHGLFAGALDNRWASGLSAEEIGGEPQAVALTQQSATMVGGVDWSDGIVVKGFFGCKDDPAAGRAMQLLQGGLRDARASFAREVREDPPPDEVGRMATKVFKDLLENAKVTRQGNTVCGRTHARVSVAEVARVLLERMQSLERMRH